MLKFIKSTYVFLGLVIFLALIIVWANFKTEKKDLLSGAHSHLLTRIEKESCKHQPCSVTANEEYYDLMHITSGELKDAYSLEFLFTSRLEQLHTKFFLIVEYRDTNDKEIKRESREVIIVEGDNYVFNEFVLDENVIEKSTKIVSYIWNPERSDFLIEGLKVSVKENRAKNHMPGLSLIRSNGYLFPENQEREFIDILLLDTPEKYKDVNTCKIDVFNFIRSPEQKKPFLVLEYTTKEGDVIAYESKVIMSDLPRNTVVINDFQNYCKENTVLKIYLFSAGKYIPNSIREIKLSFYK